MRGFRSVRKGAQAIIEAVLGIRIYRQLPRGLDIFADIETYLPRLRIERIVDVGAHVGLVALALRRRFPAAEIHSFEPTASTYKTLKANVANHDIRTHHVALSDEPGRGAMRDGLTSDLNQLTRDGAGPVAVQTLDGVFGTTRIGYLKIDVEGHDLLVLKGARELLRSGRIDIIEVEAGMGCAGTPRHVPLARFREYLDGFDYELFGIYEQVGDWVSGLERLRRANVVFASRAVLEDDAVPSAYAATVDAERLGG